MPFVEVYEIIVARNEILQLWMIRCGTGEHIRGILWDTKIVSMDVGQDHKGHGG